MPRFKRNRDHRELSMFIELEKQNMLESYKLKSNKLEDGLKHIRHQKLNDCCKYEDFKFKQK